MAVWFDGMFSEYLHVAANNGLLSGHTALTVAGWMYPDDFADPAHRQTILQSWWRTADNSLHRQALLRFVGDALQGYLYNGAAQTGGSFGLTGTTASWQHLAMTWDGSTITGYRNAVAGGTTYSHSGAIATDTNNLALGRHGDLYNAGDVEDRAIWNRCLSATEILQLYESKLRAGFFPEGLIQWWPLDCKGTLPLSYGLANGDYGLRDRGGVLPAEVGVAPHWESVAATHLDLVWPD